MKSLSEIEVGCDAKVHSIRSESHVDQRIAALGLIPKMTVRVMHVAPLGDPITVSFSGNEIILRKNEAASIAVELP